MTKSRIETVIQWPSNHFILLKLMLVQDRINNNAYGSNYGLPAIQCDPPKCDAPCKVNYSTKPCPSCDCSEATNGGYAPYNNFMGCNVRCSYPCRILGTDSRGCPLCSCSPRIGYY
ncbi:hypothetical protein NPIL_327931 [Nephila pilipes]|uniref:Uncharacterized protein n=1 Tax=Nephila pilipes TaxID=299642 RepID=A0A8X6QUW4_NEPPI|nr:hypothetical protein NPIL_327931 [Nephila pilipes]